MNRSILILFVLFCLVGESFAQGIQRTRRKNFQPGETPPPTGPPATGLIGHYEGNSGLFKDALKADPALNNDAIYTWEDQSGQGNDITQATLGDRPIVDAGALNGMDVVEFVSTDTLKLGSSLIGSGAFTSFTVVSIPDLTNYYIPWSENTDGGGDYIDMYSNHPADSIVLRLNSGATHEATANNDYTANTFHIWTAVETSNTLHELWMDGGGYNSSTTSVDPTGMNNYWLGGNPSSAFPLVGSIAEHLVYDFALNDTQLDNVWTYLLNKWFDTTEPLPNNLELHLEADSGVYNDAGTTLATDGQTVQEWHDQSGNNNDVTQTVTGDKPLFETGEQNGLPVVDFVSSDIMDTASAVITDEPFTVYVVSKSDVTTLTAPWSAADVSNTTTGFVGFHLLTAGQHRIYTRARSLTAVGDAFTGNEWSTSSYGVSTYIYTSDTSRDASYNGGTRTEGTTSVAVTGVDDFAVGARNALTPAEYFNGKIAEVLVYSEAHTDVQIAHVMNYLTTKWGL